MAQSAASLPLALHTPHSFHALSQIRLFHGFTPKSAAKKAKKPLIHSDTTDPNGANLTGFGDPPAARTLENSRPGCEGQWPSRPLRARCGLEWLYFASPQQAGRLFSLTAGTAVFLKLAPFGAVPLAIPALPLSGSAPRSPPPRSPASAPARVECFIRTRRICGCR